MTAVAKPWGEHSEEERKSVYAQLADVYSRNGNPSWLEKPKIIVQIVNNLNEADQQDQTMFSVEGMAKPSEQALVDTLSNDIKQALAGVDGAKIKITCGVGIGDKMPKVEQAGAVFGTEELVDVSHEKGQVILYDFWATWCPPCQAPMAHNQEMMKTHGSEWGGKVRIIGLSIDQTAAALKNHVESKGWTDVEHYHIRNGTCTSDKQHNISGVPHCLIVDTEGTIVFKGHPSTRKFEEDFAKLLNGEKITGTGTGAKTVVEENSTVDAETAKKALECFTLATKEFCLENKEKLKGKYQRGFLVLVDEQKLDVQTGSLSHDMTCHTVLQGFSDETEAELNTKIQLMNKGPWKNQDMVRK